MMNRFMDWTHRIRPKWVGFVVFMGVAGPVVFALAALAATFMNLAGPLALLVIFVILFIACLIYAIRTTDKDQ